VHGQILLAVPRGFSSTANGRLKGCNASTLTADMHSDTAGIPQKRWLRDTFQRPGKIVALALGQASETRPEEEAFVSAS